MTNLDLSTAYKLIAELLLHPDDRDAARIAKLRSGLAASLPGVEDLITQFLDTPESNSGDEYLQTLELSPPCPLYMGAYLFDEPSTCNGVGSSARNAYMIELAGLYHHFGLALEENELPDFIPAMVDFLWISLEQKSRDTIGLRRRYVERYVQIGLEPFREALAKYGSTYAMLVMALEATVTEDQLRMGDSPAWKAPEDDSADNVSLPILNTEDQAKSNQHHPSNHLAESRS